MRLIREYKNTTNSRRRNWFCRFILLGLIFIFRTNAAAQINSFPYEQGFESAFVEGSQIAFLQDWIGNTVASSNRIFQSSDANTGAFAVAIQPISSFDGQLDISLDLTDYQEVAINFFAKSNLNGSGDRSVLVYFSVSADGGFSFGERQQIGSNGTFPNLPGQMYSEYQYLPGPSVDNQQEVVVRISVERNEEAGVSGSAAELVMDDFLITATPFVDTTPPSILAIEAINETTVRVTFSEPLSPFNLTDFSINQGVEINEIIALPEPGVYELATSSLENGNTYELAVVDVADLSGNAITSGTAFQFTYLVLGVPEPGDIVINEFMPDPTPVLALPDAEFVELWNVSDKFLEASALLIDGNPLTDFIIAPNSYLLVVEDVDAPLFVAFEAVTTVDALTLSNGADIIYLESADGAFLFQAAYEESIGGRSFELVNPFDPCISDESFLVSADPEGGTPGFQNSVFDSTPDTESPFVLSYQLSDALYLEFSESIDATSVTLENFESDLEISQAVTASDFTSQVQVFFSEELVVGQVYELSIQGIKDCSGNQMDAVTVLFGVGRSPGFNELLITEIYFDPSPSFGLPDFEYIELYNATEFLIATEGVEFSDASGLVVLGNQVILPGDYLVVSSMGAFQEFGTPVLEVAGFPSLNNSGELLSLSFRGELLFSVRYAPQWHDDFKVDGGFSLEMIDATNPCMESRANWRSSIAATGGTPGAVNSVAEPGSIPDSFGPSLEQVYAISKDSIILTFSEKVDPSSVSAAMFFIEPSVTLSDTTIFGLGGSEMLLILSDSLQENVAYLLTLSGITDCSGNEMNEQERVFGRPMTPQSGELFLSEVLFNPLPGSVDFVEIHNASERFLSMFGWFLARLDEEGLDDIAALDHPSFVIAPNDYLVFTEDVRQLSLDYPLGDASRFRELIRMPSFSNDTGNVLLVAPLGEIEEHLFYDEDFHYALLEDVDGISLERVSYEVSAGISDNWRSAASTEGFATPGRVNSQRRPEALASGKLSVSPKAFIPGNAGLGRDFTQIHYQFPGPGRFANVTIYDNQGRKVKTVSTGASLPVEGFFRWDGDTDSGSMARMGYYLVLFEVYDGQGNSEILKETVAVGRNF